MNPQWHDEFVVLCALYSSGELTEEEWALLQVHLAYCDSCRVVFEQYKQIASGVIPAMAANAYSEIESNPEPLPFALAAAEQKLMRRLDSESPEIQSVSRRKIASRPLVGLIAACAVGLASFVGIYQMKPRPRNPANPVPIGNSAQASPPKTLTEPKSDLRPQSELAQREAAALRQQLNSLEEKYQQSNSNAESVAKQLEADQGERTRISEERDTLNQQLTAERSEAQSLREKSAQDSDLSAQQAGQSVALESRIRDLNLALADKDRMLALDKDLLAHDRDIRDLIGARDLAIIDIQDVGPNGETAKPGGRMFYTKNQSMVFYGYDLDKQAGLKDSVTFQAWGSRDDKRNVSLGLFFQDDTHKRWVLRFNDPKILARLNRVFVTAEPRGGSSKPTGKPLLSAYLQMQPNHP